MRPKRVRLLVWWQFPRGSRPGSSARVGASWEPQFFDQDSPGGARTMPATNQWAVSMLIREVLVDPDLAGWASSVACSGPGRAGLVGVRGRRRDRRAAPRRARRSAPTGATASASRRWPPPPARSSSPFPSCAPDPSSPPCSTRAGVWTRPGCAVICSARSRGRLHPQGGRPGAGPGQRVGHQPLHGLADPRRASTSGSRSSCPAAWTAPGSPPVRRAPPTST